MDGDVALGVHAGQVAGLVPAIGGEVLVILVQDAVIVVDGVGTPGEQLAPLSGGERGAVAVYDAQLVVGGDGGALGGQDLVQRVVLLGGADESFGGAEDLDEHVAEQLYGAFRIRHREHGAAYINLPQGAQIRLGQQLPRLHEQVQESRDENQGVDLLRADEGEHIQRGSIAGDDRFAAVEEDAQDAGMGQGEVMPQGERGEQSGLVAPMVFARRLHTAVVVVPMGARDELGDAGGAAGQEQDGDAFVRRLGFHHRFRRHVGHLLHAGEVLDAGVGQVEPAVDLALDAAQLPDAVVGEHEDGHDLLQHQRQEHLDEGDAVGHL